MELQRVGHDLVTEQQPPSARDVGSVFGLGRSPGEGNGNPLQYSCLGNTMDRGGWWPQSMESQRVRHHLVTELQYH